MAANVGRGVSKHLNLVIDDSNGTLRDVPISNVSLLGLVYEETDITAYQDAVRGRLPNMPDAPITVTGPFSTAAAVGASGTAVAPALSGSHTVLEPLNGGFTALTADVQFGIEHTWETGEPQFGITASGNTGYLVFSYVVDFNNGIYTLELRIKAGSGAPDWGTAAET